MSIQIADSQEPRPGTSSPATASNTAMLARSDAYERLCNELRRYISGETSGRSFLICGHRGAGKTTLVLKAIEDTTTDALRTGATRPLFVPLHGPDLLPTFPATEQSGQVSLSHAGSVSPAQSASGDTQESLKQITIGIYRALADLFFQAYWKVAQANFTLTVPSWRDLPELAAQLRIELDGPPDLALLREYWKRAGALPDGVLQLSRSDVPETYRSTWPRNQGMLELVALSSAAQAYKVIRGRIEAKHEEKQDSTRKNSIAIQTVGEIKNLLNPLLGALAGGAVGLGLKSADVSSAVSALAGAATGLGTAVTLNFSSSRSRESSRKIETTFLPDTSIASLDRTLPLLVGRCRDAGLAPVFVVDELDKVARLSERMGSLVRHLKYLVTEKTFFCFLADRSYLEALRRSLVETAYRAEHTYFSDRIFVVYRPADLHEYLGKVLQIGGVVAPDDKLDFPVLPYMLLHRSRLHPFDLRRLLGRLRVAGGAISLPPGAVRSDLAYRFDVLIQVAVEWLLQQPETRNRLAQDEDFTQMVYDTLYYPSRMWEKGLPELDVSKETFFSYLGRRMSPSLETESPSKWSRNSNDCPLSDMDKDFLFGRLIQLVGFLTDAKRLYDAVSVTDPAQGLTPLDTSVLTALPVDPKFRLLDSKTPNVYTWRYDSYGRSVKPPGVGSVLAEFPPHQEFIDSVQNALHQTVGPNMELERLATEYGVLSTTPAWSSVQQALRRLETLEGVAQPYPEMESDSNAVWEFSQMLRSNGAAIAAALIAARILGEVSPFTPASTANIHEDKILHGLPALAGQLSLSTLKPLEKRDRLIRLTMDMERVFPGLSFNQASFDLSSVTVDAWSKALTVALGSPAIALASPSRSFEFGESVTSAWQERFSRFFRDGTTSFEPKAEDLVCGAAGVGMSPILRLDLSEMTIDAWTYFVIHCLSEVRVGAGDPNKFPALFGFAALVQLGFGKEVVDYGRRGLPLQNAPNIDAELQAARPELEGWIRSMDLRRSPVARPGIVVIRDFNSAMTLEWKPSTKYAATVTDSHNLGRLRQAMQPVWRDGLITRVVLETGPIFSFASQPLPPTTSALEPFPELLNVPYNYICPAGPPTPIPSGFPLVISPKSLDEAVDQAPAAPPPTNLPNKLNL
jgi:hypothetical protein